MKRKHCRNFGELADAIADCFEDQEKTLKKIVGLLESIKRSLETKTN